MYIKIRSSRSEIILKIEGQQFYQKETPIKAFFCKICEIFKNTFFYRTPPLTVSEKSSIVVPNRRYLVNSYFVIEVRFNSFRGSRPDVFCETNVLRNLAEFTGKHLCQNFFFNKAAGLRPATLLKDSGTGVFLRILQNF